MAAMEVVISNDIYKDIVKHIEAFNGEWNVLEVFLAEKFKLPVITARSIIAQTFKRWMKFSHYRVKNQAADIYNRYKIAVHNKRPPGVICRLSKELSSSPCLIAKLVLEGYYLSAKKSRKLQNSTNSTNATKPDQAHRGKHTAAYLRDTSLIPDARLAHEILMCTLYDTHYGNISELCNRLVGEEHEERLYRAAEKFRLSFQSEKELREGGYDKTPDLKLNVPVAVDGFVINWIESKALFGNWDDHKGYIEDQYSSYWNRFGPGLVIYWFGYVTAIADPAEKRFIVRGNFPTEFTYMKPLSIVPGVSS